MTRLQQQIDELTTQRASEWLEVLKSGDAGQHATFVRWVTESPRHLDEFLTLAALDRQLPDLDFASRFDLDALLAEVSPAVTTLDATHKPLRMKTRRFTNSRRWAGGLAAGVAVLALPLLLYLQWRGAGMEQVTFETAAGEQRSVELQDGSLLHINARTSLQLRFDDTRRDIHLLRGEALFKVAEDAARPFQVHTRDAVVRALGTEFNVHARPDGTTVAVLEGKVQVSGNGAETTPAALQAGESAGIDPAGVIERDVPAVIAQALAWRQRRLVFEQTPLEQVVYEFNRYNRSPQLRLQGIAQGSRHYSGQFDADDPQSLAAFLAREPDLSVTQRDGQIVISPR